jgi:hypothetical protein
LHELRWLGKPLLFVCSLSSASCQSLAPNVEYHLVRYEKAAIFLTSMFAPRMDQFFLEVCVKTSYFVTVVFCLACTGYDKQATLLLQWNTNWAIIICRTNCICRTNRLLLMRVLKLVAVNCNLHVQKWLSMTCFIPGVQWTPSGTLDFMF